MSQQKKLEFSERLRTLRKSLKLSQEAMAERLGVSGNYIHLLESGRDPGDSLLKLFEVFEAEHASLSEEIHRFQDKPGDVVPAIFARLSIETLISSLSDLAKTFLKAAPAERKYVLSNLQSILDELHAREIQAGDPEIILHQKRKPAPSSLLTSQEEAVLDEHVQEIVNAPGDAAESPKPSGAAGPQSHKPSQSRPSSPDSKTPRPGGGAKDQK